MRTAIAAVLISTAVVGGTFAGLTVLFGKTFLIVVAGVLGAMVLFGLACDLHHAVRTTRRTRFPLAPDPEKARIERDSGGGWWAG
jgi:hypothetical protein